MEGHLKDLIAQGFEGLKKTTKDFQNVTSVLQQYRATSLVLYEVGLKLANELRKLSEQETSNKYMFTINKIAADLEQAEKHRYDFQSQIWDVTLLPLLQSEETDQKETQTTEKQVKNFYQKLDSQIKKETRNLNKQNKKKRVDTDIVNSIQAEIETMKTKQHDLWSYFLAYKDHRYYKWTSSLGGLCDIFSNYHNSSVQTYNSRHWVPVVGDQPAELPQVTFVEAPKPPSTPRIEPEAKIGEVSSVKYGYLVKQGGNVKNWKKRWFVLTGSKLMYYKTSNVAKEAPLKQLLLADCVKCEPAEANKENCFVLRTRNRDFYVCAESPLEMQSWMDALNRAIPNRASKIDDIPYIPPVDNNEDPNTNDGNSNSNEDNAQPENLPENEADGPDDWQVYYTDDGDEYWYNEKTGETLWERPF